MWHTRWWGLLPRRGSRGVHSFVAPRHTKKDGWAGYGKVAAPRTRREPEPYQRYRAPLQQKWRPSILARDRHRCRACGSKDAPEVAHITDAAAFVRAAGRVARAVTFSYRWDNLVTLCQACHRASHVFRVKDEDLPRRQAVQDLWARLRKLRGWSSPYAVLPPDMVPEALRPQRSFHDVMRLSPLVPFPTFAKYAADGGMVFGDEERGATQVRLAALPLPQDTPPPWPPHRSD